MGELIGALLLLKLSIAISFAQTGIASKYSRDQNIANDVDVIFSQNFETSLPTILSSFSNSPDSAVFEKSSDRPASSGGTSSVILHPVGIKTTLYKLLPSDYEQIYFRYYMKYGGTDYHHTGGFVGGLNYAIKIQRRGKKF